MKHEFVLMGGINVNQPSDASWEQGTPNARRMVLNLIII